MLYEIKGICPDKTKNATNHIPDIEGLSKPSSEKAYNYCSTYTIIFYNTGENDEEYEIVNKDRSVVGTLRKIRHAKDEKKNLPGGANKYIFQSVFY